MITATDALGHAVTNVYDALGRRATTFGATYPVDSGYDTQGRQISLVTRYGAADAEAETRWTYDPVTGLCSAKTYADDTDVSYTYDDASRPVRTTWARGAWREYAYNDDGLHTATAYSDATPAVSLAYDAFQRLAAISNTVAAFIYANGALGAATNETAAIGTKRFSYTWDAENRLAAVYSNATCIVSNAYDHQSRRILKATPSATHTFVYDGWNLVRETVATSSGTVTNCYIWGKDLSGTLHGAGGVGGLLAGGKNGNYYFPFLDNNGNVTAYAAASGVIVASYTYNAFGNTIAQSGPMADDFSFRFSTKYYDTETGLYYYGYRFYAPWLRRWLNRDPIEEEGGVNLYLNSINNLIDKYDAIGLWTISRQSDQSWANAKAEKGDTFQVAAFRLHLAGAVLAAHNASFDMSVLDALLGYYHNKGWTYRSVAHRTGCEHRGGRVWLRGSRRANDLENQVVEN